MSAVLPPDAVRDEDDEDSFDTLLALLQRWKLLLFVPILAGCVAIGISYFVPMTFTARTAFLPPQQPASPAAALASLSALANISGSAAGLRTPADQLVALAQSTTVLDRIIDRFELMKVYGEDLRADTRRGLADNTRVALGKREGIISVEVDDRVPQRAADIANAYVEELRKLTATLALTEAQQRRTFFERQLALTRDKLTAAQIALQDSGIGAGTLKAEPRAAAEAYSRLRAEATAAEVRLAALRGSLVDSAPEVMQQLAQLGALRAQLAAAASADSGQGGPDYIGRYREFKYQETLFDLFARQYELARVDEAREGALFQVIDAAQPPEKKSKPKRSIVGVLTTLAVGALLLVWVLVRHALSRQGPERAQRLRRALAGR